MRLGRLEVLQKIEIRLSVRPHGHQLTIEHSVGRKVVELLADVVKLMIQHVLSTGVKCCLPASAHNLESVAVELDLLCCVAIYVVLDSLTSFLVGSDAIWRNITDRSHSIYNPRF